MKPTYFDFQKNWRRVGPVFKSPKASDIWFPNMIEHQEQRAEEYKIKFKNYFPRTRYSCPAAFDSCDWRFDRNKRGPSPAFWDYACHGACHYVADLCLFVAHTCYPETGWRIITSDKHSVVWNGDVNRPVLFDVNFAAIGVKATEAWELANHKGRTLKPLRWLRPWCVAWQLWPN